MIGFQTLRWWEFGLCLLFVFVAGPLCVFWMLWRDQKKERKRP